VHAAGSDAREALEGLQQYRAGDFKVEVGVALRAHDTPDALNQFEGLYDYVQVMGIDHEGLQGQPPDEHHKDIELVRALRQKYPTLLIQVDGAVAPRVKELASVGANRLVVGSAIVNADNPKAAYKALISRANKEYTEANGTER
jgi:pentose-5-phosphate-3-epimerase